MGAAVSCLLKPISIILSFLLAISFAFEVTANWGGSGIEWDLVKVGALGGTLVNAVFEIVTVFPSCCPGFESAAGWGLGISAIVDVLCYTMLCIKGSPAIICTGFVAVIDKAGSKASSTCDGAIKYAIWVFLIVTAILQLISAFADTLSRCMPCLGGLDAKGGSSSYADLEKSGGGTPKGRTRRSSKAATAAAAGGSDSDEAAFELTKSSRGGAGRKGRSGAAQDAFDSGSESDDGMDDDTRGLADVMGSSDEDTVRGSGRTASRATKKGGYTRTGR